MRAKYAWILAALIARAIPALGQEGAPFTVTIHGGYTHRQLVTSVRADVNGQRLAFGPDNQITGWLKCADPNCFPSSFGGSGPSTVRAHYDFIAEMDNLPDAKVAADINLTFGCAPYQSRLVSQATFTNFRIDLPIALRAALPGIGELIQDFVRHQSATLTEGIMDQLGDQVSVPDIQLTVCPRFSTSAAGDVTLDFTSGTQCTSGDRQEQACPSRQSGRGKRWVCNNGWWIVTMNDCKSPPKLPPAANRRNYGPQ